MPERDPPAPPSHEVAGEDFLFHLYRGSELLQDNRVHDAKAELEQALKFQPSDPKGQDLLGIVYFRLGLYPRAIAIYEQLVQSHPDAIEPRVNLALSYLKTGQAQAARFELERVVEQNPHHARAWGYLGLAFQRLGDYERASHAFAAGGHDVMARRLLDMAMQAAGAAATASLAPDPTAPPRETRRPPAPDLRAMMPIATHAYEVSRDLPPPSRLPATTWTAIDADPTRASAPPPPPVRASSPPPAPPPPREATPPAPSVSSGPSPATLPMPLGIASMPAPATAPMHGGIAPPPGPPSTPPIAPASTRTPLSSPLSSPLSERPRASAPIPVSQAFRDALLVFPRALPIARHPSGLVLVQAHDGFAVRLDAVRTMALSAPAGDPLPRRVRGRVIDEPLGGAASPVLLLAGKCELCLAASQGHQLSVLALGEEPLYLREDAIAGFDAEVAYENGRLPVGDGDAIPMVQLKGPGSVVASLPEACHAVEVMDGRHLTVRAAHVIAWSGRLLPRALFASDSPAGARGLCAFSGEGMVLIDGRR